MQRQDLSTNTVSSLPWDTSGQGAVGVAIDAVPGTEGLYIASDGDVGIGTTSLVSSFTL